MKKQLYTLNIGNYNPDITSITYPLFKHYCKKIGAEFCEITTRKFPEWPITYEKMQMFELSQGNDWSIYIDADGLISPDCFDITEFLPRDTCLHWGMDSANMRWKFDDYFRRDGRNIGTAGWLTVASDWTRDIWTPSDLSPAEILSRIFPTNKERAAGCQPEHFVDEYNTSRNIARYGLKFTTLSRLQQSKGILGEYFWHGYAMPEHEKIMGMRNVIEHHKLENFYS